MFRKMRRSGQEMPHEECVNVLIEEPRGVLALSGDDGYPYAVPMDHYYDEETGKLFFHGAGEGHKFDAMMRNPKASYCVFDRGTQKNGDWALSFRSVIVFGRMSVLKDRNEIITCVRKFGRKFYPTPEAAEAEIEKARERVSCYVLTPEKITGKYVTER